MENFFSRYKNPLVLMAVLFIQVIALATQVKRAENSKAANSGGTRLIRVWTVTAIAPFERTLVSTGHFFRNTWHNYIDLHNVRKQNLELQDEVARLKLEQVQLREDAHQAQRLQALLDFKQRYIGRVLPAQVIGTSGSEQSRLITIDKGSNDHIKVDMPVITPDGIVGKIKDVFPLSSQVLLINDRESGAGVVLQNSRLQGILRGTAGGELNVSDIMSDEKVEPGEPVVTSGGDRVYPRGVPVGTVTAVSPDRENDPFLAIRVKPAADLNRLEEVLVVTNVTDQLPASTAGPGTQRAADILAERLPSVSKPDSNASKPASGAVNSPGATNPTNQAQNLVPAQNQVSPKTQIPAQPKAPAPSGITQKPEAPAAERKTEPKPPAETKAGVEAKKTAGANSSTATTGKSAVPGPGATVPAAAGATAAPKPKPTPATAAPASATSTTQPKAASLPATAAPKPKPKPKPTPTPAAPASTTSTTQPKAASSTSVKKPKPQASPSAAAPAATPEATKPENGPPAAERPPQ